MDKLIILNVGCGDNILRSCINSDMVFSFYLLKHPLITTILYRFRLLSDKAYNFIKDNKENVNCIVPSNAVNLKFNDNTFDVVYCSHMIEHLTYNDASTFLLESKRVLKESGTLRLLLPDLDYYIQQYQMHKNADEFMKQTYLGEVETGKRNLKRKIKKTIWGNGTDRHLYMYNKESILSLLQKNGYSQITFLKPGQTTIENLPLDIDLFYREKDSIYIEAKIEQKQVKN